MTRRRDILACWLLVSGYAFMAIAGHGGLHALSGDDHAHCHGLAGHHHGATAEHEHRHSGHCHHTHHHHSSEKTPDEMPQAPLPVEHDDNCLICVVLASPVQVTDADTFEPVDTIPCSNCDEPFLSHEGVDSSTPPVRGPPVA